MVLQLFFSNMCNIKIKLRPVRVTTLFIQGKAETEQTFREQEFQ